MLWEWNVSTNAVECIHVCRGHERGLECVGISRSESRMATGGFDTKLKIWSAGKVLHILKCFQFCFEICRLSSLKCTVSLKLEKFKILLV